jgi:hypothetical protein
LRDAWKNAFRRRSLPKTEDLLNGTAAMRFVSPPELDNAHLVRRCRNAIVHEGSEAADAVSLGQAKSYLCLFFSRLPLTW